MVQQYHEILLENLRKKELNNIKVSKWTNISSTIKKIHTSDLSSIEKKQFKATLEIVRENNPFNFLIAIDGSCESEFAFQTIIS